MLSGFPFRCRFEDVFENGCKTPLPRIRARHKSVERVVVFEDFFLRLDFFILNILEQADITGDGGISYDFTGIVFFGCDFL